MALGYSVVNFTNFLRLRLLLKSISLKIARLEEKGKYGYLFLKT